MPWLRGRRKGNQDPIQDEPEEGEVIGDDTDVYCDFRGDGVIVERYSDGEGQIYYTVRSSCNAKWHVLLHSRLMRVVGIGPGMMLRVISAAHPVEPKPGDLVHFSDNDEPDEDRLWGLSIYDVI